MNDIEDLTSSGFAVIKGLLDQDSIASLRSTAENCVTQSDLYVYGRMALEAFPEIILPLICLPRMLDACEGVMGPFVQLDSFSVVGLKPGGSTGLSWHRDVYGSVPRSLVFERPLALNLLVYLQDLTLEVGPLRVIPGSHRDPLVLSDAQRHLPHPDEKILYLEAGDGVLIHNNLVHSRSPNSGDRDRIHLSVVYTLSCMRTAINTEVEPLNVLLHEAVRVNNVRIMRLLGRDIYAESRFNAGFLRDDHKLWDEWLETDRRGA